MSPDRHGSNLAINNVEGSSSLRREQWHGQGQGHGHAHGTGDMLSGDMTGKGPLRQGIRGSRQGSLQPGELLLNFNYQ